MKRTKVDESGDVRCPKCGAKSFQAKRTMKGKVAFGVLAAKHLKCLGCGTMLKTG